ncbi:Nuclear pore complex protein [Dirofilaria immitis]
MPDADLSPCVRDYLKHVEELDRTYGNIELASNGGNTSTSTCDSKNDETINELPKSSLSEKDISDGSGIIVKSSAVHSHEDIAQEKPVSNEIIVFNSTKNSAAVPKLSFDTSAASLTGSEKRGRKRAKKGGPEGGDDEVIISNHNTPISPRYSTSTEKSHIKTTPNQTSLSSPLLSRFNSSNAETTLKKDFDGKDNSKTEVKNGGFQKKGMDDTKETGTSKIPLFLFSQQNDLKKNESLGNSPNFVFNKSSSEKGLEENVNEKKEQDEELAGKSNVTPAFSFWKPNVTERNYECSDSSKTKLEFKFDVPPTIQSEPNNESEESEYVPPKPTAVLTEEPKAIFSSKCSVFVLKGTEYEKLGIGQLHIKTDETDSGKKILLIRAATATGTVWVNSYIDDTMKHVTVEDAKLRISCVSSGLPSTYLLRLPKKEDRDQVVAELQGDNTSC